MSKANKKTSIKYQLKSFRWAFSGLSEFFRTEAKAIIHLVVALLVILLGIVTKITSIEWALVTVAMGIVFISEIVNTALEHAAATIPDKYDHKRKTIKDLGAAAVLMASISALIIGILIIYKQYVE